MKKTLQDLTIKDDFMFGAVMAEEENCRGLLERVTGLSIGRVEISRERSLAYRPEYRGIRLDVYVKDEKNTRYNVEMQMVRKAALEKRARYYRSQMDMDLLLAGESYENLPDTYVIFICDFDLFGAGRYRYTFENCCLEDLNQKLKDGCRFIFLNTHGKNREEVPGELVSFLEFVRADLKESARDFQDEFVKQLQETIWKIKASRDMEERFMTLEELLRDTEKEAKAEGRAEGKAEGKIEGKAEGILELLEDKGSISERLRNRILAEKTPEVLKSWLKLAASAESVEQFEREM